MPIKSKSQYKLKKIKNGPTIQVDLQIVRWREKRRKAEKLAQVEALKTELRAKIEETLSNASNSPIDEESLVIAPTPFSMFE
jgi:hypothetical protein